MPSEVRRKLVMIGVDAADLDFIGSSISSLPTFKRLLADDAAFRLRSSAEVLAGSPWPTFYTGSHPGEHGLYFPMQWDAAAMRQRRLAPDWFAAQPFWYELARQGVAVTVLDAPFTFPSQLENGVEVNNWGTHDVLGPFDSNRKDIAREIRRSFGTHPMGYEIPLRRSRSQLERTRDDLVAGAGSKGALSRWMAAQTDWDFFLTVFSECHRGGHMLWPEPGDDTLETVPAALLDVYRAVDAAVGDFLDTVDLKTTTVIVFALHGMGSNYSQVHFLPEFMDRINGQFGNAGAGRPQRPTPGFIRRLRQWAPSRVQRFVAQAVPATVRDWVIDREFSGAKDWSRTPGFVLRCDLQGAVRLNLAGRESAGVLDPGGESRRRYEDWLTRSLLSLRDQATGAQLVNRIEATREVFPGRRCDLLPDLIVHWNDLPQCRQIESDLVGEFSARPNDGRSGEHRPGGFAVVLGQDAEHVIGQDIGHITDLGHLARRLLADSGIADPVPS